MRLISANVNGIRAAIRRGGMEWLDARAPDVVAFQEVRATREQWVRALVNQDMDEWSLALESGSVKGRNGVAVLSKEPIEDSRGAEVLDASGAADGRWVEADIPHQSGGAPGSAICVISAYVHSGEVGTEAQEQKYAMLEAMDKRLADLESSGRSVVLTGDFNVCHTANDLKNWKGNRGKSGFLPEEQQYLSRWLDRGWVDVIRDRAGDVEGPYTWWSWRGQAFDRDTGWRIDYQLATPDLAGHVQDWMIGRAPDYASRWSDHAPVLVDYATTPAASVAAS